MSVRLPGADGVGLAADVVGPADGALVVLLHGFGQTRRSWRGVADRLAASGRRAAAVDLRGHGESDFAPDGRYGWDQFTDDLVTLTAALGGPAVMVGASLGGKVGLVTAARPDAASVVRGLVLVDTVPRTRPEGIAQVAGVMNAPADGFDSPQHAAETVAAARGAAVAPGAGERMRRNLRQDAEGRWRWHWDSRLTGADHGLSATAALDRLEAAAARVRAPTLIVRGENSEVVDQAGVDALLALIPHAEVAMIAGAGHMVVGDANDAFGDALIAFLERRGL